MEQELSAYILRIERISLSDGAGMRTVVFFKGCPMRCAWCSTPESQIAIPQVYYKKERCRGCGACVKACPSLALSLDPETHKVIRDVDKCTNCGRCVEVCNYHSQKIYGEEMTVSQVMKEIMKDELFYFHSGGGVTLSGGSALLYPDFAHELLLRCKELAINTAGEFAMYAPEYNVRQVVPLLDSFYVDVKSMDPEVHRRYTGRSNEKIQANIRLASQICKKDAIHARTPLIWDINDDRENIRKTAEFCASVENCSELEFLPYHSLGLHAYEELQRPYPLRRLKSMTVEEAVSKVDFLLARDWPFNIRVSGRLIYTAKGREKAQSAVSAENWWAP